MFLLLVHCSLLLLSFNRKLCSSVAPQQLCGTRSCGKRARKGHFHGHEHPCAHRGRQSAQPPDTSGTSDFQFLTTCRDGILYMFLVPLLPTRQNRALHRTKNIHACLVYCHKTLDGILCTCQKKAIAQIHYRKSKVQACHCL